MVEEGFTLSFMTPLLDVPQSDFPNTDEALAFLFLRNLVKRWHGFFLVLVTPDTPGAVSLSGKHTGYWTLGRITYDSHLRGWDVVVSGGHVGEYRAWARHKQDLVQIVGDLADMGDGGYTDEASHFLFSANNQFHENLMRGDLLCSR